MKKRYWIKRVPNLRKNFLLQPFKIGGFCVVALLNLAEGHAQTATQSIQLSLGSFFLPLQIHEQTLNYSRQDSAYSLEGLASFSCLSTFGHTFSGIGFRYTKQLDTQWIYILSGEYSSLLSVDLGLQYRPSIEHQLSVYCGMNPGSTSGILSHQYQVGEQPIRVLMSGTRVYGQYTLQPDPFWKLHLHIIRNARQADFLLGIYHRSVYFRQQFGTQISWQDGSNSLYGTLIWYGKQFTCRTFGMYTEFLGWSTGISVGYTFGTSSQKYTLKEVLP